MGLQLKNRKIFIPLTLGFVLFFVFYQYNYHVLEENELDEFGKYTLGEIHDFKRVARGSPSTYYHYIVDDKKYYGTGNYVIKDGKYGVGQKILIYYSSRKPEIHRFYFYVTFPDSSELGKVIDWDWETGRVRQIPYKSE